MSRILVAEHTPITVDESSRGYQRARAGYFAGLALRHFDVMRMHVDNGQFGVIPAEVDGAVQEIRARAAVQHCMVEAARARVLGEMLGLDRATVGDLEKAALLHDSYKGQEVKMMKEQGPSWDSYDAAQAAARESWERSGRFSTEVMDIAGSVAHESLPAMQEILAKSTEELTAADKARLAMHYLDDYTVEFDWANPAANDGNDLDRRMTKNENNERYRGLNETGREHFGGRTAYQAQREIGHQVESRLAELISNEYGGYEFNALDLPVLIDNQIKLDIMGGAQPAEVI